MRFVLGWLKSASAVLLAGVLATDAMSAVVISFAQSGSDVVATFSGSVSNLSGSLGQSGTAAAADLAVYQGLTQQISNYQATAAIDIYEITPLSVPASSWLNIANVLHTADAATLTGLSMFAVREKLDNPAGSRLFISSAYVQGSSIGGSMTFRNKTLSGMNAYYGDFVYQLNNGGDTITVRFVDPNAGGGAVPEPTSMSIFGLGALGLAYRARRKAKA